MGLGEIPGRYQFKRYDSRCNRSGRWLGSWNELLF